MNTTFKTALISLICIWIVLMAAAACRGEPGASKPKPRWELHFGAMAKARQV